MMKKKFFAVALATTMAVSTVMTAAAETVTVSNSGWWDAWTPGYEVADGTTLELDVDIVKGGPDVFKSLNAAFVNTKTDGKTAPSDFDGYQEYVVLRSDNFGWGTDYANTRYTGTDYLFISADTDYSPILTGAHYDITIKRDGNKINYDYVITEKDGTVLNCGYEINAADLSGGCYVFFTGDAGVEFTISEVETGKDDSTVEEPSTGEDGATVETPSASDTKKDDTTAPSEKEDTTKNLSASTDDSVVSPSPKPGDSVVSPSPKPGTVTPTGSTVTPGTTTPTGSTYVPATTVDDKQDSVSNVKSEERENVEKNAKIEGLEAAGLPADTQLRVSNILKTDASYTSAVSFLEKSYLNKDYVLVDLTLNSPTEGAKSGQLKSKIKVTLPVFKALEKASKVDIYRYDSETNTYVKIDSSAVTDGNITFETDHFTPYLFVEANAETPSGNNDATTATKATNTTNTDKSNSPKTGDSTTAAVFGFTAMASVAAILASKKKFAK